MVGLDAVMSEESEITSEACTLNLYALNILQIPEIV